MTAASAAAGMLGRVPSYRPGVNKGPFLRGDAWVVVCPYERLEPERGVAALVGGEQVAIFLTHDGNLYATDNYDPYARAYVLSRGIVGTRAEVPTVASPLHKQSYDLRTGVCLDLPGVSVRTYEVRCRDGLVEVRCPSS